MANLIELAMKLDTIWADDAESRCALYDAAAALRELAQQQPVECNPADYCVARHIKCYAAPIQMRNDISDALKGVAK